MLSLRLATLIALSAALLLALIPRVTKADISLLEEFEVAGWSGGAYAEDDGPGYCSLSRQYDSDTTLGFILGEPALYLFLSRPDWRLPVGERYTLTLRVDQSWRRQLTGEVTGETILIIPLGRDVEALQSLKRGRFLEIDARHQSFDFELMGTSRALNRLERCVERLVDAGTANPFGGPAEPLGEHSGNQPENPFGQETLGALPNSDNWDRLGFRLSPVGLRLALMGLSGSMDVHIYPPEADASWVDIEVEGVAGRYMEVPNDWREPDAPRAFRKVVKAFAGACPREPDFGVLARDVVEENGFLRGFLACHEPDLYTEMIVWTEPYLAIVLGFGEPRSRQLEVEAITGGIYRMLVLGAMQSAGEAGAQPD